ncbi:MAG: putative N6-adenine-specific methylase, partial [Clostridia bacterium]|nr:putative N6-adenine-specific methylase [Clostridia bacterium]
GVDEYIHLKQMNVNDFYSNEKFGFIITNPPYGERLGEIREVEKLYKDISKLYSRLNNWSLYLITSYEGFERLFGKRADKRRKLYNGRIECQYYQFLGAKPEKQSIVSEEE